MTLPHLTKRQQEILELIPQFRFFNRTHIQSLLHHKDKQQINKWLTDLTNKEYLTKIYDNKIIGENRIPAIYYLGSNGKKYLKSLNTFDGTLFRRFSTERDRSEGFISHCLLVASICCDLEKKNSELVAYEYITKNELLNQNNAFHFLVENGLTVDLCFSKKQKGKKILYFLLEIFDASLPRYRLKKRVRDYIDFFYGNEWENNTNTPFPTILFVCETKERMIYTKRYTKSFLEEHDYPENLMTHVAVAEDVKEYGVTGGVWEQV